MAALVVDASVTMAWVLPDEVHAPRATALIDLITASGAVVPQVWPLEMANAVLMAERRGRLRGETAEEIAARLADLPIAIDPAAQGEVWTRTMPLARRHSLTAYDASYLELAGRLALPLATFDARLRRAAEAERIPLAG